MKIYNKMRLLLVTVALVCMTAHAEQTVVIDTGNGGGTVTISPTAPVSGDVVTLTVTPRSGYGIAKSAISVEATLPAELAQAPRRVNGPDVAFMIDLQGDEPTDIGAPVSYTFVMPDDPLGVLITARFSKHTAIDRLDADSAVADVRYVNTAGMVSERPWSGVNIVVTTLANGTRNTHKIVIKD